MSLKSGQKLVPLANDESILNIDMFRVEPGGWVMSKTLLEILDKCYEFKFRETDVLIMSFTKCGSTWMQEIVWTLLHNPNLDNPRAVRSTNYRCPVFEGDAYVKSLPKSLLEPGSKLHSAFVAEYPDRNPLEGIYIQLAELAKDPRAFKTHLTFDILPPSTIDTCKTIYITREPKDMILSNYNFAKLFKASNYDDTLDEFVDLFVAKETFFSTYWLHVKQAWEKRHHPNLLFIHYEDLKANPKAEISRIAKFIGLDLTESQIDNVVHYTSFGQMKERDNFAEDGKSNLVVNNDVQKKEGGFFNKGKTGSWKQAMSEELVKKIDHWTEENLKQFDDDFKYKKEYFDSRS